MVCARGSSSVCRRGGGGRSSWRGARRRRERSGQLPPTAAAQPPAHLHRVLHLDLEGLQQQRHEAHGVFLRVLRLGGGEHVEGA